MNMQHLKMQTTRQIDTVNISHKYVKELKSADSGSWFHTLINTLWKNTALHMKVLL